MVVPFKSTVVSTTVNVDTIGRAPLVESLVTLNECPFTNSGNIKKDVEKTSRVLL